MSLDDRPPAEAPKSIARVGDAARLADEVAFAALRDFAIAQTQKASGDVWTDYNLHDPGVTMLEAVCYALTEIVYRADFPVPDLICGPDGSLDFERLALITPEKIYSSSATTVADHRRLLLDRGAIRGSPAFEDVRFEPAGDRLEPVHRLSLIPAVAARETPGAATRVARGLFCANRPLGEDLDEPIRIIVERRCCLRLDASIQDSRPAPNILADILDVAERRIARRPERRDMSDLSRSGAHLETIFNGPEMVGGAVVVLPPEPPPEGGEEAYGREELALSDLRAELLQIPGVSTIAAIGLRVAGDTDERVMTRVLNWTGHLEAPRLWIPNASPDPKSSEAGHEIVLRRAGAPISIDWKAALARFADIRSDQMGPPAAAEAPPLTPPPRGEVRSPFHFYSVRNLLPPLYGVGPEGLSSAADPERVAQVSQLHAYLTLFDQLLFNTGNQLEHLADLYSVDEPDPDQGSARSYWRPALTEVEAPALKSLYDAEFAGRRDQSLSGFDDAADRRARLLDHMLAIYGETYDSGGLGRFLPHLDHAERSQTLLAGKTAFLRDVVTAGQGRNRGFDYDSELSIWPDPTAGAVEKAPGYAVRLGLLLGFADPRPRPLTAWREALAADHAVAEASAEGVGQPQGAEPLAWSRGAMQPLSDDEARTFRRDYPIPASVLFAAALDRRSYWWTPPGSFHGSGALWLGPDGNGAGGWWVLARCDDAGAARRVADWLRRRMLALSTQSEGMHIVEHVLLRPRSDVRATPTTGMEFRVTVVLPNWTARMRPPTFRNYARQVFTAQSPAHLLIDQVWLGPIEMARFEGAYSAWMRALRAWSRAQQDQRSALAEVLDRTSADLRVWTMLAGSQGEAGAG